MMDSIFSTKPEWVFFMDINAAFSNIKWRSKLRCSESWCCFCLRSPINAKSNPFRGPPNNPSGEGLGILVGDIWTFINGCSVPADIRWHRPHCLHNGDWIIGRAAWIAIMHWSLKNASECVRYPVAFHLSNVLCQLDVRALANSVI